MHVYSNEERQEILSIFLKNNKSAPATITEYRERYPGRPCPSKPTIIRIYRTFRDTSSVKRKKRVVPESQEIDLNILLHVEENSELSLRKLSKILHQEGHERRSSVNKVRSVLKKNSYLAYKRQHVQHLTEEQKRKRVEFCQNMLQRMDEDPNLPFRVLWSDESTFPTCGEVNKQNNRMWATNNPNFTKIIKTQGRQSVNVWCGILNYRVIGPVFFERSLTGEIYLDLLEKFLTDFLVTLPLEQLRNLIYQQDGASPHNIREVQHFLDANFVDRQEWPNTLAPK